MNKQELIKHFEEMEYVSIHQMGKQNFIDLIEQLDEPQKPVVPKFMADLIEEARIYKWDLDDVFDHIVEEPGDSEIYIWFYTPGNIDVFARAWLDGYEVKEEKRFLVKIIGITDYNSYLNYRKAEKAWTIESKMEIDTIRTNHTYEELEQAGFGWVFDCPGIEIEEVME